MHLPAATSAPATVCYDSNQDGDCDAGEPTTLTSGTGAYRLTGLPSTQGEGAALLAQVPAGSGAAYTLKAPVSRPEFITPITTLVQVGISQGMARQAVETAVARQLQVDVSSLYGDHRTLSAGVQRAWHETLAAFIVHQLQNGTPLRVGPSASAGTDYYVDSFYYTDATNHYLGYSYSTGSVDPATGLQSEYSFSREVRDSQRRPIFSSDFRWVLTPSGWMLNMFDAFAYPQTTGNPFVALSPTGHLSIASAHDEDVGGQTVSAAVARTAASTNGNTFATINLPAGFVPPGTMPAGARLRTLRYAQMASPAQYLSDSDRVPVNQPSVAALIAAYPRLASGTPVTEQNTALIGSRARAWVDAWGSGQSCWTQFSTNALGIRTCVDADLRATFDSAGSAIHFELCDHAFGGPPSSENCRPAGSAPLVAGILSGTVPSLRVDPMPEVAAPFLGNQVLTEHQGRIYKATPPMSATTVPPIYTITQMNRRAFSALADTLRLAAPNPSFTVPSPFMGVWQLNAGTHSRCEAVVVDAAGDLIGACQSPAGAMTIGTVLQNGVASFTIPSYNTSFSGQFAPANATGNWSHNATLTGTWSATKY
ncbi:hypothetical protein [Piscinibacter gummiphilus]|uniref:Uncharacterized protein n=1 Tax=Piscinibacter gummiphilus TaxID=946333 RepID=A0ABZ0CRR2_9BURK|nr:hypothetical protein [Piscinibacter gummiphilus]WOB07629.1 hypothetical protein RXV79_22290 [Piscinibacter gummiphilus]